MALRGQFITNQSIANVDQQLLALENDISNLPDMTGATAAVNNILCVVVVARVRAASGAASPVRCCSSAQ